ncbi:MAG: hypothetical protein K2K91_10005 [Ruminococcus sp.]|nr:hypothetical protein [Ruminococcus sp.]MDE7097804.1 hypothetical protein [Ruminococcus sp.]
MKNKTIATILALTVAMSCACAGCDKDSVIEQSNMTSDADVVVIPDSVKAKLKSAVEVEPVPVRRTAGLMKLCWILFASTVKR